MTGALSRHLRTYLEACQQIEPIETGLIVPAANQIRADLGDLTELCASIKEHGLLQPILVRPKNSKFEIVCGNRRFEACRRLMKRHIDCVVRDLSDPIAFELSIIENIQRNTISPVEEARAYRQYVVDFGWGGVTDLAKKVGKSQEYISHRMALLELPDSVLSKISRGDITPSQAQELVWIKRPESRTAITALVEKENLSINEIRKIKKSLEVVEKHTFTEPEFTKRRDPSNETTTNKKAVEDAILGLRVALVRMDSVISRIPSKETKSALMRERYELHGMIDRLISLKTKMP